MFSVVGNKVVLIAGGRYRARQSLVHFMPSRVAVKLVDSLMRFPITWHLFCDQLFFQQRTTILLCWMSRRSILSAVFLNIFGIVATEFDSILLNHELVLRYNKNLGNYLLLKVFGFKYEPFFRYLELCYKTTTAGFYKVYERYLN